MVLYRDSIKRHNIVEKIMEAVMKYFFLFSLFIPWIVFSPSWATAQTVNMEPLMVTAQKMLQEEVRTPVSVDVFGAMDLQDKNIQTLKDLSLYTSNVHIKADNVGNATIIRGIAPFTATLNGPAGIFIDGVALPTVFMQQPEFLNVERIEVLKGPQGTLYGSNTESGVINIITATPDNRIMGDATAEYYLYDKKGSPPGTRLGASFSSPLIRDKFYLSLAAAMDKTHGYFENIYNNDDRAGEYDRKDFHLKLRSTPSSALEINFSSLYMDADDAKGKFRYSRGPAATDLYTINYNDGYDQDYTGAVNALNVQYDFDNGLSLCAITGLSLYDRNFAKDFDGTPSNKGLALFDLDDTEPWFGTFF